MKENIADGIRQWYIATYGDVLEAEDYEDLADVTLHIVQASPIAWAASVDTLTKLKTWHRAQAEYIALRGPGGEVSRNDGFERALEILGLLEAVKAYK